MINSLTGKMGQAVALASKNAGLTILPYTLCGAGDRNSMGSSMEYLGQQFQLVGPDGRDAVLDDLKVGAASHKG